MRTTRFKIFTALALAASAAIAPPAAAQSSTDAVVRVVDIGAGLCVVITVPGGHAMLYDAGPPGATRCVDAARAMVPGRRFDLVVLSHSDNDHVSMIPALLRDRRDGSRGEFSAAAIIHPGDPRGPALVPVRAAIDDQADRGACVYNLHAIDNPPPGGVRPAGPPPCRPGPARIAPGDSFRVGAATATFVAGWSNGNLARSPGEASITDPGPRNNALSIVIRFEYGGHSVLLTGDTVGRMLRDPADTCAYSEQRMVRNVASVPIASDVLIGQHHGANNSSSECFLDAVRPTFVVFSAGSKHQHPTETAFLRLTDRRRVRPILPANIFRTDCGDNEPGGFEMRAGRGLRRDPRGDDDVEVRLPRSRTARVTVAYRAAAGHCR